jgi:hypothetical protein
MAATLEGRGMTARVRWIPSPQLLAEARYSPTLAYMIKNNLPLTREQWISMNYLGHPPEPWTAEHEYELPRSFQLSEEDAAWRPISTASGY